MVYLAGLDIGAKNIKVVILKDGQIVSRALNPAGFDTWAAALNTFETALKDASISREQIEAVGATGVGRKEVYQRPPINAPQQLSEVAAGALGTVLFFPTTRTVIDVGAEEGRAVRCDEKGGVKDFAINERCAAGAGTFIETMARTLEVSLDDMGPLSLKSQKAIPMNAQCAVFAESEVVSLIHARTPKEDISRAIHDSMASRIASMVRRVGVEREVALIGGVARNPGFIDSLKRDLALEILVPQEPEYVGALGAALASVRKG